LKIKRDVQFALNLARKLMSREAPSAQEHCSLASLPVWAQSCFSDLFCLEPITWLTTEAAGASFDTDAVVSRGATVTVIFPSTHKKSIMEKIKSIRPGAKENPADAFRNKCEKEIHILGKLQKGSLPYWHKSKTSLPPSKNTEHLICIHLQLRKCVETEAGRKRQRHIVNNCMCPFDVVLRDLVLVAGEASYYVSVTFEYGKHVHSCDPNQSHRAPLTPEDEAFLLAAYLRHGTAEVVWRDEIAPMINDHDPRRFMTPRLLAMTKCDIEYFGKKHKLENLIKPGQSDFAEVTRMLDDWSRREANIAYKFPGQCPHTCSTISDKAKKYLTKEDLFIFVQTEVQLALLKQYGDCAATDATHCTLSYNKAKLISVHVTSFGDAKVRERGFNVAFVITTSERADVHRAIVAQILTRSGESWRPKLLMTDIAFAAYNAWVDFFPDLQWMWCVFHVWQAWKRKLDHLERPDGMKDADFKQHKGSITGEILSLISPDKSVPLYWADFDRRCDALLKVVYGLGLRNLAQYLESYIKKKHHWAPPARREAVDTAIGVGFPLPMLAVSNNSLERFFGVLKWTILKGKAAWTLCALMTCWDTQQARLKVDAVKAGIKLGELLRYEVTEEEAVESNEVEDDFDPRSDDESDGEDAAQDDVDENEDRAKDAAESLTDSAFSAGADRPRNSQARANQALLQSCRAMEEMCKDLVIWVENSPGDSLERLNLSRSLDRQFQVCVSALRSISPVSVHTLGEVVVSRFQKQRGNYGIPEDIITEEVLAFSQVEMYKAPREKPQESRKAESEDSEPFAELAARLLASEEFLQSVENNKMLSSSDSFPVLRSSLERNTCARLFGAINLILEQNCKRRDRKQNYVDLIVTAISSFLSTTCGAAGRAIEANIADFGRAKVDSGDVKKGELVLLRPNSLDSHGTPCTAECDHLLGYIIREGRCVDVEISTSAMRWGQLHSRLKNVDDLKA
jgi:hypothetical protein